MTEELDLLKSRIDYRLMLRLLGIPFIEKEAEGALYFRCLNPDHEDRDPSMKVQFRTRGTAEIGHWRCWNRACYRWGKDILDLIRVMKHCDLRHAIEFVTKVTEGVTGVDVLMALASEQIDAINLAPRHSFAQKPSPIFLPEPNRPIEPTHDFFTKIRRHPMDSRWACEEGAVLVTSGPYEGYMVVPLRWHDGDTITFQAFAAEPGAVERRHERYPGIAAERRLYPPKAPVDRLLHGLNRGVAGGVAVVVEGIFDNWRVWSALAAHHDEFVTWYGLAAFSNRFTHGSRIGHDQATLLRPWFPREIVVLHDNDPDPDKPGVEPDGVKLVLDVGEAFGYTCPVSVGRLPEGHDPDSAGIEAIVEALRARESYAGWAVRRAAGPRPRVSLADLAGDL